MCDNMYYENKQKPKLKNTTKIEEESPELEMIEEQPLSINA